MPSTQGSGTQSRGLQCDMKNRNEKCPSSSYIYETGGRFACDLRLRSMMPWWGCAVLFTSHSPSLGHLTQLRLTCCSHESWIQADGGMP